MEIASCPIDSMVMFHSYSNVYQFIRGDLFFQNAKNHNWENSRRHVLITIMRNYGCNHASIDVVKRTQFVQCSRHHAWVGSELADPVSVTGLFCSPVGYSWNTQEEYSRFFKTFDHVSPCIWGYLEAILSDFSGTPGVNDHLEQLWV